MKQEERELRLWVDSDGGVSGNRRAVAVSIERDEATVEDLARALKFAGDGLLIDDVSHPGDVLLSALAMVEGTRVRPLSSQDPGPSGLGTSWVGVSGGPHSGELKRLHGDGAVTIGRGAHNDLDIDNTSVSAQHAVIEKSAAVVRIRDLGSTNGTWVDAKAVSERAALSGGQTARVGSSTIAVVEVDRTDKPLATSGAHADVDGRVLFNRPPRGPVPKPPELVAVPEVLPERQNPTLRVVSLLVPIVLAIVMVVALDSFRFALFALFSPLLLLGNWVAGRRTVKKERRGDVMTRRASLQKLRKDLDEAERAERARRSEFAPNLLELRRRVELPSNRLWERRLDDPDALTIRLGVGSVPWTATAELNGEDEVDEEVRALLTNATALDGIEVLANLREGPIGFVGAEGDARSATRSGLLQLAAHHGPADLNLAVLTSPERVAQWEWTQWLPHARTPNGGVRVLTGEQSVDFASSLLDHLDGDSARSPKAVVDPGLLVVVDDLQALHRKSSPIRRLIGRTEQNIFAIVLAPVEDRLPASISTIVTIAGEDGEFERRQPSRPGVVETGIIDGVSAETAEDIAVALARFDDPEVVSAEGDLPARVLAQHILPEQLFGDDASSAIRQRWLESKQSHQLTVPLGASASGPFDIDLVHDGPHGLIAGTTGAGKSELLRTTVLGLALNYDPDDLVFVLIDYKGGSAFDACATLPHVVGFVTDLDDHLAERALQSLEAELYHRETVLRRARCSDIVDYRDAGSPNGPLPRLVVVVDEFATLRTELPHFVKSLVGIAQRGRSLGVHLVLATQRPSGAVDANIRANTNLRIALRVQDAADSNDVIDHPGAVDLARENPGRALIRRGEGELTLVQTAYVSSEVAAGGPPVRVGESRLGGVPPAFEAEDIAGGVTQMQSLVEAITEAATNHEPARRPWLEDLPLRISNPADLEDLAPGDKAHVVLAVGDDPLQQRRVTLGWNLDEGHLAVVGGPGSGVTTTLRSAIVALGTGGEERPVWVFPVDHGAGGLSGIDAYPHVGEAIAGSDEERQERLLQFLSHTLDERRSARHDAVLAEEPLIIVAIDGIAGFAELNEIEAATPNGAVFNRLGRDGPSVGIHFAVGARAWADLPRTLRNSTRQFVVLEQIDERGYLDFAMRIKNLPDFVPGRALFGAGPMVGQVIDWERAAESGLVDVSDAGQPPTIDGLTSAVSIGDLPAAKTEPELSIPFGLADSTRGPATLTLRAGEHCLIAGPTRSGRTTTLRTIATQLRDADRDLVLVGVVPPGVSTLVTSTPDGVFDATGTSTDLEHVLAAAVGDDRRWVVLVDDADRIQLEQGALFDLARTGYTNATIIASVRASTARQSYGHWTRFVRSSGTGILLEPDPLGDGELLSVRLPRGRRLDPVPGRGFLVHAGVAEIVQVAR